MGIKRERKPFKLGLDPSIYNRQGFKTIEDESVIAKEYARLRREAQQRLTRLGKSEFRESKAYTENVNRFKRLDQIKSREELERLTQEAARFVTARASSASGQRGIRRDIITSLQEDSEIYWVNTKNFNDFTEFMEELRAKNEDRLFYSKYPKMPDESVKDKKTRSKELRALFEEWLENGKTFG